jgi:hypothetical protein
MYQRIPQELRGELDTLPSLLDYRCISRIDMISLLPPLFTDTLSSHHTQIEYHFTLARVVSSHHSFGASTPRDVQILSVSHGYEMPAPASARKCKVSSGKHGLPDNGSRAAGRFRKYPVE